MKKILAICLMSVASTSFAGSFVIQDIQVNGISPAMKPYFLANLPVKVGSKMNDSDISELVRQLYYKGYSAPSVDRVGNSLKITVQPQLTINSVTYTGNKAVPDEGIKENLKLAGVAVGDVYNQAKVKAFTEELLKYLKSVGHYNAKVTPEITKLPDGRVNIKLVFEEGKPAKLKSVTFVGNKEFRAGRLEGEMDLSPDSWWKIWGGNFEQAKLDKDLQALQMFYFNKGYAQMKITDVKVDLNKAQTEANIKISIDEGKEYTVTKTRIVGNLGGIEPKKFDDTLSSIDIGKPFRRIDVTKAEEKIKRVLGNHGFGTPKIQISPTFDEEKATMEITFVVDAGSRYTVREIRFVGNTISADSTLRQEMRQQEGAWLSSQDVELGKTRLDRTGFFNDVKLETVAVPNVPDQVDIEYRVNERNTGSINVGIGYGTESGFSYNANIQQDNFLGMGSSIGFGGSHNDDETTIGFNYNEPYFTKDGIGLGGSIYYNYYNNDNQDNVASYKKKSFGINGTLTVPVNETNSYYIGLGATWNKLINIRPEYHRHLYMESIGIDTTKEDTFKAWDYIVSLGWIYNSLDRGYFPTSGIKASIGGKVTAPPSKNRYFTTNAEIQGFYPFDRDHFWVLQGKLSASFANGFSGRRLPFYQYYSAGGIGSVRGFSYGTIGPKAYYLNGKGEWYQSDDVIGGNAMALASISLIVPTPFVTDKNQNTVRTSVFVDAGSVWDTHWKKDRLSYFTNDPFGKANRIRVSSGIGFQWMSPIGLLAFSYAWPIKKYENDDIENFQFSIGTSF